MLAPRLQTSSLQTVRYKRLLRRPLGLCGILPWWPELTETDGESYPQTKAQKTTLIHSTLPNTE